MTNWIKKTKPTWLLMIPNFKTLGLVYVLLMLFLARHSISLFIINKLDRYLLPISNFLSTNIIANWVTFIYFVIICIILLSKITKKLNHSWLLIFCIFVIYYIITGNEWKWVVSPIGLDYGWLITLFLFISAVICGYYLISHILSAPRKIDNSNEVSGFSVTTDKGNMQETGWRLYVENLVSKLLVTNLSEESFAVGVSGVWGSGKTTFLKTTEQVLKNKVYLINFNPWNCESSSQISTDFFDSLLSGLSISSSQRKTISRYSRMLAQVDGLQSHIKLFDSIFDSINPSLADAKKEAEKVIASMPLPVVVIIDDLDRLEGAELTTILKLIRISANFKNLIFIVSYDKAYINKTMSGVGGGDFLKKIITLEICLPDYEEIVREYHLYSELKCGLTNDSILNEIHDIIFHGISSHRISFFLPTFRDVKRFANLFCLDINSFVRAQMLLEINVRDFFYLELLHYYDYDAYQYLKTRPSELIQRTTNNFKKIAYSYSNINADNSNKQQEIADNQKKETLKKFKEGFADILLALFGPINNDKDNLMRYPVNYTKYYSFRITDETISLKEFNDFLSLQNPVQVQNKIHDYCLGKIPKYNALYYHLISQTLNHNNQLQVFNVIFSLIELWKYNHFPIGNVCKALLSKKTNKEPVLIPQAFRDAVLQQINISQNKSAIGIQELLTSLVQYDIYDQTDVEGHYVDYESIISWDLLQELSEANFMTILGDRIIPIRDITDRNSQFNQFLRKAVANIAIEYFPDDKNAQYKKSLLVNKLVSIYSNIDNKNELGSFFINLRQDPNYDINNDYDDVNSNNIILANIESIFGNDEKFDDFKKFISAAFRGYESEVNDWLIKLNLGSFIIKNNVIK